MPSTPTPIESLFQYLQEVVTYRLRVEYQLGKPTLPKLNRSKLKKSLLTQFIKDNKLSNQEVIILLLALAPHLSPYLFTSIFSNLFPTGGEFIEFGGVKGKNHRGIIPTGETALYVLFGNDISARIVGMDIMQGTSMLFRKGILYLQQVPEGEPAMSGQLHINEESLALLIYGVVLKPTMSRDFPAQLIQTDMGWDDLILQEKTLNEIKEIKTWLAHNDTLLIDWNMKDKIKPGYRVMMFGPPGTGKTLTVSLLGKLTNRDVYRVDLSLLVSKYIGETGKNLAKLFDKAVDKDWILFFDEADSIFGKRTSVKDAHDKYANQEASYLLQRIETHPGLVILASNFKNNIDSAFSRRFHSMIEFVIPSYSERFRLWENILPRNIKLEKTISSEILAKKYPLTGSSIVNIIQYACLKTLENSEKVILEKHLIDGIRKEYMKEGKTVY